MATTLPQDSFDHPIPALRFLDGGAHSVSATSTAARNAAAFNGDTRVISLYATVPVYVKFGGSDVTVTASDHYFPAGIYYDVAIGGESTAHSAYISVLAADSNGTVYISEKQ